MRIIAGVVLAVAGLAFGYWMLVWGTHDPIEWIFVTAFGWLMCYDVWHRFFGRKEPAAGGPVHRGSLTRRPHPRF